MIFNDWYNALDDSVRGAIDFTDLQLLHADGVAEDVTVAQARKHLNTPDQE